MRNFLLGTCCGVILGAGVATLGVAPAQSPSQPWNPYAPGSFNSSTNLYNSQLDADTDNYLNSQRGLYSSPLPYSVNPCPR